jgi:rRNA maturation protein Nop10
MRELAILAKCRKCGRGFVTLPKKLPAFDPFGPADQHYRVGDNIPVCGGRIELTHEGSVTASTDTGSVT